MSKKQTGYHEKKKRSWKQRLLFWTCFLLVVNILIFVLFIVVGKSSAAVTIRYKNYWLACLAIDCAIVALYLMIYRLDAQNFTLKQNDLEDSAWLKLKQLKRMKEFTLSSWADKTDFDDEIVIGAEMKKTGMEIVSTSQLHALILGTSGTGKTTGWVDQNIEILSLSKNRPSMIITDPKTELYQLHAKQLEKRGYKVSLLDLRMPFASQRWNPMQVLIRRIKMVKAIRDQLQNKGDGKYCAAGEIFLSRKAADIRIQELWDEIFDNARDLVYTLCPIQNTKQPNWEQGARNLIFALVLAFCEDFADGKLEEEQMQIFNVYHNITKYCSEDTTVLANYLLQNRGEFSKVRGLANTVLITGDVTLTSYLSEVNQYMQGLSDDGMLSMMSSSETDIIELDEAPNAIFLAFPDEKITRHRFVTLFVVQAYKELTEKASLNERRAETDSMTLKRKVYFVLDEFGQLPKIENIGNMIAVARSRGIRFLFILQSYTQLNTVYGTDVAATIKDNCNVKIFIGTDDEASRKAFSELCGQRKIGNISVNTAIVNPASSNTSAVNQPLITPGELERLNGEEKGNAIVSVRGYHPIWTRLTPSYELAELYFPEGKAYTGDRESRFFDKDQIVFDIGVETSKRRKQAEQKRTEELSDLASSEVMNEKAERRDRTIIFDKSWNEIKAEIDKKIEAVCETLEEQDAKDVRNAELRDKTSLLYGLMEHYTDSVSERIERVADYLESEALPNLEKLQNAAIK